MPPAQYQRAQPNIVIHGPNMPAPGGYQQIFQQRPVEYHMYSTQRHPQIIYPQQFIQNPPQQHIQPNQYGEQIQYTAAPLQMPPTQQMQTNTAPYPTYISYQNGQPANWAASKCNQLIIFFSFK